MGSYSQNMDSELLLYVFKYYGQFMTAAERRAYTHLVGALKATLGGSDLAAQNEARKHHHFKTFMSSDPEVLRLASDGFEAFRQQTATRIFAEHRGEISLNNCPRCGRLARTPTAQQCRYCSHDWHERA